MPYAQRLTALFLCCALPALAAAETSFSSLEERMTGREFQETGLHKLTAEELAALNRWIHERSAAPLVLDRDREVAETAAVTGDRRGLREDERQRDGPIRSRIKGSFTGWTGDTEFELENGMVWRQVDANNKFSTRELINPEVEIRPAFMSSWQLRVEGYNQRVRVERVE